MFGKDLIKKAFRLENVDRIPWVPFVGCHGGKLLNLTATKYLKSAEYLPCEMFDRFNIEVLTTTDMATDLLEHHRRIKESDWNGNIILISILKNTPVTIKNPNLIFYYPPYIKL